MFSKTPQNYAFKSKLNSQAFQFYVKIRVFHIHTSKMFSNILLYFYYACTALIITVTFTIIRAKFGMTARITYLNTTFCMSITLFLVIKYAVRFRLTSNQFIGIMLKNSYP